MAKSLPQLFLVSKDVASSSIDLSVFAGDGSRAEGGSTSWVLSSPSGEEGVEFVASSTLAGGFIAKKPFKLCCPFETPFDSDLLFFAAGAVLVLDTLRFRPFALAGD